MRTFTCLSLKLSLSCCSFKSHFCRKFCFEVSMHSLKPTFLGEGDFIQHKHCTSKHDSCVISFTLLSLCPVLHLRCRWRNVMLQARRIKSWDKIHADICLDTTSSLIDFDLLNNYPPSSLPSFLPSHHKL